MNIAVVGCNSERQDPVSGSTHLGNGYRAYSPHLMRFHAADSWSPFGAGGINPWTYCAGDPVNRADPSGHIGWQGITGIVTGAIGIALVPFTLGQSLTATVAILAGLETLAGATSIASGILENVSPRASSALGWVSFAMGVASVSTGMAALGVRALKKLGPGLSASMDGSNGIQLTRFVSARYAVPGRTLTDLPTEILTKDIIPHLDNAGLGRLSQLSHRMNWLATPHLLSRLESEITTFVDKFRGQSEYAEQFAFLYKWYTVENKTDDMINVFERVFNQHIKNPAEGPLMEFETVRSRYSFNFSREHGVVACKIDGGYHFTADRGMVMATVPGKERLIDSRPGEILISGMRTRFPFPHYIDWG